jgi:hypothetical protein
MATSRCARAGAIDRSPMVILSVSSATLTLSSVISPPTDVAVTLPVLNGTTTRMAPRCAWSQGLELRCALPQHALVSDRVAPVEERATS